MFDTNIFDEILSGNLDLKFIKSKSFFVTHIQFDQIKAITDDSRRQLLLKIFKQVNQQGIPSENFALDVSRLGGAKLGNPQVLENVLGNQSRNEGNLKDALIADTCIKNVITLVSKDRRLRNSVIRNGGLAISLEEFKRL